MKGKILFYAILDIAGTVREKYELVFQEIVYEQKCEDSPKKLFHANGCEGIRTILMLYVCNCIFNKTAFSFCIFSAFVLLPFDAYVIYRYLDTFRWILLSQYFTC